MFSAQRLDYHSLFRLVVNELQCNESLEGGRKGIRYQSSSTFSLSSSLLCPADERTSRTTRRSMTANLQIFMPHRIATSAAVAVALSLTHLEFSLSHWLAVALRTLMQIWRLYCFTQSFSFSRNLKVSKSRLVQRLSPPSRRRGIE